MRQTIEQLIRAVEGARTTRQAIDHAQAPVVWARADQACMEAGGRLAHEVQEAVRRLGLVRDLSRALAGSGFAVARTALDQTDLCLRVELSGGPETLAERRQAGRPATAERVRALADDFFSRTGVEVAFPYADLAR